LITGTIQTTKTNDWGFTSYKVNGVWYGADAKGPPRASEGESVAFEDFQKSGKDGRQWPTIKLATFRKVAAQAPAAHPSGMGTGAAASHPVAHSSRDSYWTDKAISDAAKDPRISLQGAYKVAVEFLPIALANGALPDFAKAKPVQKLEILQAFLDEEAQRIHTASYAAKVPTVSDDGDKSNPVTESDSDKAEPVTTESEEQWS
jgi:hypothetical protein